MKAPVGDKPSFYRGSEIMQYDKGKHTIYHHRYHLVWITKYRKKVLTGAIRERVREIARQVCEEIGVTIIKGVLSTDHVHMFVSSPPHRSVSDVMRRVKGRTSRKIQMEFPDLRKRYWGRHYWARGYFCTTSGVVNDDTILQYIETHATKSTGISR